ncbi:hypothetical protein RFI_09803, partial [Reticulomyxa filosa]
NAFALTKFQAACILGHWDDVRRMGALVEALSLKAGKLGKNNHFNNYTMRALEQRGGGFDFGQFYKFCLCLSKFLLMINVLQEKIPPTMLDSPKFEEWTIHALRYKNLNPTATLEEDSQFVMTHEQMIDTERYSVLFPVSQQRGTWIAVPSVIQHAGRLSDTKESFIEWSFLLVPLVKKKNSFFFLFPESYGLFFITLLQTQFEWTYPLSHERQMVRKVGKMELERLPFTRTIEDSGNLFETGSQGTGYVWEGTLEVTMEKWEDPEEFGRRQVAYINEMYNLPSNPYESTHTETPGGNATPKSTRAKREISTQIYHVELVIENKRIVEGENDYENQGDDGK